MNDVASVFFKANGEGECFRLFSAHYYLWDFRAVLRICPQVSATMARLKKESERRTKTARKERNARAVERRKRRRAGKEDDDDDSGDEVEALQKEGGGGFVSSRREGGGEQGKVGVAAKQEEEEEISDGEEHKEEEKEGEKEEDFDPEEGLLFVYVCTHAAVVSKGKGVAGTYLIAANTSWKSKEQLAKTAVLLETFAAAVARIQV